MFIYPTIHSTRSPGVGGPEVPSFQGSLGSPSTAPFLSQLVLGVVREPPAPGASPRPAWMLSEGADPGGEASPPSAGPGGPQERVPVGGTTASRGHRGHARLCEEATGSAPPPAGRPGPGQVAEGESASQRRRGAIPRSN